MVHLTILLQADYGPEAWRLNCNIRNGKIKLEWQEPLYSQARVQSSSFPASCLAQGTTFCLLFPALLWVPDLVMSCHDDGEENHVQNRNRICHHVYLF